MAKIIGGIGAGLSGFINELSFYKLTGVEGTIVRRKSGHTKEKIKTDPNLKQFRRGISEFGGRSRASKYIMEALTFQKPLADYNIAGPLNALMQPVQELDKEGDYGQRDIILSAWPHILKGFSLNRRHILDSVIRNPISYSLQRETISASVHIPELVPGINFAPPVSHPYYGFVVSLGVVPDILYNGNGYEPSHHSYTKLGSHTIYSEWYPLLEGSPAVDMELTYPLMPPDNNFTLVLAFGIRYGILKSATHIKQAPHVGSAKIIEVG